MNTKAILAAFALTVAGAATQLDAQPTQGTWQYGESYNRETFWRGAPDGLQQRIDWLQQRINRGIADGSLERNEARRAQRQLDALRRDAAKLQRQLDDLGRSIRWSRRDGRYRDDRYGDRDPFATDYDASRYYRDDPRYQERRLGPNDEIYRGSDGRYYCKRSDGTTGLVLGMVGGAALGNLLDGGHNRTAGTLLGGALGALLGQAIDQNSDVRCR
jgi:hypothetical protein